MNKTTYMWLDTLGGIDKLVFYVFCGIAGVISVLALAVYVIGCFRRKSVLSSMDEWITLGGLFLTTTVIIRGLDPIWTNDQSRDILCQIYPCLLTLGLTYFVGGMFVKGVGIFFHYNQKKNEQTKKANQCGPGVFFVLLLIVAAAVIIVWALLFPMESRDITSDASQPTYQCYGDKMGYWRSAVLIYHGVMLVLALIIVWAALVQVPPGRPSGETKLLTFMVYFVAFVCIIPGLVIYYLLNPPSRVATIHYAVNGGLTLLATLMTLLLLVISKSLTSGRRSSYDKQKNSSDLEMYEEMRREKRKTVAEPSLSQIEYTVAKSEPAVVYNTDMIPREVRAAMRRKTGRATKKPPANQGKTSVPNKESHAETTSKRSPKNKVITAKGNYLPLQDPSIHIAKLKETVISTSEVGLASGCSSTVDHDAVSKGGGSFPDDDCSNSRESASVSRDFATNQPETVQHTASSPELAALVAGEKLKEASADNFGFTDSALNVLEVKPDCRPDHADVDRYADKHENTQSDDKANDEATDDNKQTGANLEESRQKFPAITNLLDISDTSADINSGLHGSTDQSQNCKKSETLAESLTLNSQEKQTLSDVKDDSSGAADILDMALEAMECFDDSWRSESDK